MHPRSRLPAIPIYIQIGTERVDKWLKEEFRRHCAKSWGSEEKEFYIEIDGIKIFGHADGVPTLETYGRTVTEADRSVTTLLLPREY